MDSTMSENLERTDAGISAPATGILISDPPWMRKRSVLVVAVLAWLYLADAVLIGVALGRAYATPICAWVFFFFYLSTPFLAWFCLLLGTAAVSAAIKGAITRHGPMLKFGAGALVLLAIEGYVYFRALKALAGNLYF